MVQKPHGNWLAIPNAIIYQKWHMELLAQSSNNINISCPYPTAIRNGTLYPASLIICFPAASQMAGTVITQSICNSGLIAPPRELVTFFLRWNRVCAITSRRKNSVSLSATTLVLRSTFYRTIRFMFKYHLQHKC